jgi:hypothetical protein
MSYLFQQTGSWDGSFEHRHLMTKKARLMLAQVARGSVLVPNKPVLKRVL